MKKVQLIICLLLILTGIKTVHAKETINWLVVDWSPWMILQGENKGKGVTDYVMKIAHENMPEYNHQSNLLGSP